MIKQLLIERSADGMASHPLIMSQTKIKSYNFEGNILLLRL